MLTHRQLQLLKFIHIEISTKGVCPDFDEMTAHMGLNSKSGVHRMVTALEERGFIRRIKNRARAIEVIKLPFHMSFSPSGFRELGTHLRRAPEPVPMQFKAAFDCAGSRLPTEEQWAKIALALSDAREGVLDQVKSRKPYRVSFVVTIVEQQSSVRPALPSAQHMS